MEISLQAKCLERIDWCIKVETTVQDMCYKNAFNSFLRFSHKMALPWNDVLVGVSFVL